MSPLDIVYLVWSFSLGAVIASFLNVVIWRVPRGESIVRPPSHCPKCNAPIRWYQNIPILSWLALRGRCAHCHAPISPRYILIETLGGVLFAAAWLRYGSFSLPLLVLSWIWIALMITGAMIDYDHRLLPDFVTIGGIVLGLLFALLLSLLPAISQSHNPTISHYHTITISQFQPLLVSLAGLALGFGLFLLIRVVGGWVFHREAMGMGDVLLMGAVGAISGPVAVIFVLIFSSLFGSVLGLTGKILMHFHNPTISQSHNITISQFTELPYGPFICAAHLLWMLHGPEILYRYLELLRP